MTPPPPTSTADVVALESVDWAAPSGSARALRPAKPSAVVVPPLALTVFAGLLVAMVQARLGSDVLPLAGGAGAAALTLFALGCGYALRAIVEEARGPRVGLAVGIVSPVAILFVLDYLLAGVALHPGVYGVAAVVLPSIQPVAHYWRRCWEQRPPQQVSLLAGSPEAANAALRRLDHLSAIQVVDVVLPVSNRDVPRAIAGRRVLRGQAALDSAQRRVVVSSPRRDSPIDHMVARLVMAGRDIVSESAQARRAEGRVDSVHVSPLNLLLSRPRRPLMDALSRGLDLILAGILLALLSPLLIAIAVAVRLDSPGPAIFRQRRIGFRGRTFTVLKFRSMFVDAEAATGPTWARKRDSRVTRVGRILRRTRLDELPQLINVLLGEMSVVGPRPERAHFYDVLREDIPLFELRTAVRPGITGWAQVRADYAAATEQSRTKLEFDLYYILCRSPMFDLAILFETVRVALRGLGAR